MGESVEPVVRLLVVIRALNCFADIAGRFGAPPAVVEHSRCGTKESTTNIPSGTEF
jgi:hypothetical protein